MGDSRQLGDADPVPAESPIQPSADAGHSMPPAPSTDGPDPVLGAPPAAGPNPIQQTEPATKPVDDEPTLWLRRSDQLFVGSLAIAAAVLMGVYWLRLSGWGLETVEIERHDPQWFEYKIDVNSASWVEWAQLEGIGQVLAERIVADREQNGPFTSIEDLGRVRGIGPKTIEKLRPSLQLDQPATNRVDNPHRNANSNALESPAPRGVRAPAQ